MNTTVEITPIHITGELSPKRVGAYMKQSHKLYNIRVQRLEDGSFFLADEFVVVWVPQHPDLLPFTFFPQEWERATFEHGEQVAREDGPDIAALWHGWIQCEMDELTLTASLIETTGERNKTGTLARKFATYDLQEERYITYINKKMCDLLNPGLEELREFRFETSGFEKPVRVAARNGYIAVIMPMCNVHVETLQTYSGRGLSSPHIS